ncbi:MAG: aminotransferase class III-fold pyridoxal phosphate-dependent enzyme [Rhodocyclales bacterium]|nr:aminotransferase class III-fold pyridoxal phosphate-dependent enzyme [Rhodocyclales bacterium]
MKSRIPESLAMQERARLRIPGMTQLLSKRPDMFSLGVWPGYYSRAQGAEIWDLDGNRYIDMSIGGIGANVLGYADPDVDAAVIEAIKGGVSSSLNCPEEVELADLLCEIHPWAEMARYTRSGGESMALAVRIARAHTGRDKLAFCGYHGWHDWYLAANLGTGNELGTHLLPGLEPAGVPAGLKGTALPFRYGKLDDLKDIVTGNKGELAAIVMEPIRNEHPGDEFLQGARQLANEAGAVLVVDEISAGLRTNSGGAHLWLGLQPDIAVFSKALGNGYPIGAVIGKGRVMQAAQRSFISSTCWTERTGPTAALATLRKHRERNVGGHLVAIGELVQAGWRSLFAKHRLPASVRGIPPLSHFAFDHPLAQSIKALFVQLMLEKGFLASNSFYAMYAHQKEHVEAYLVAADAVLSEVATALVNGRVEERLEGKPSAVGFKRLT